MILLLGGTRETATVAHALVKAGSTVLVSTATDIALDVGDSPRIRRRCGRLDEPMMIDCIRRYGVVAVVDAAHPYAAELHRTAGRAAKNACVPLFRLDRASIAEGLEGVHAVRGHDEAARTAFSFAKPVLLTTGSRNLKPYTREARQHNLRLVVRVLPHHESLEACLEAGLPEEDVIQARGPFTVEENRAVIREHHAGVLVTKDSGQVGGVLEKLEAARAEGCEAVVISRPPSSSPQVFESVTALLEALTGALRVGAEAKSG